MSRIVERQQHLPSSRAKPRDLSFSGNAPQDKRQDASRLKEPSPSQPCPDRRFYVYILSNVSRTLYVGVTNNLERRVWEHRQKQVEGFTKDYNVTMLVHLEEYARADDAIAREKQLKKWRREKKVWLIEQENPQWLDLAHDWFGE